MYLGLDLPICLIASCCNFSLSHDWCQAQRNDSYSLTLGCVTDALAWRRAVIVWPPEVHTSKKPMAPLSPMSFKGKRHHAPPPMAQTQGYSFKTHASPPSSLNIALPPWNPPTIPFLIRLLPPSVIMLRPIYVVAGVSNLLLFPGSVSSYTIICLPILLLLNIWLAYNFWLLQTKLPWTFTFCMNIFFLLGKYIGMKWLGHVIGVCLTF